MGDLAFDPGIPLAMFDFALNVYPDLGAFVETGTCLGASVVKAAGCFNEVWSCELDPSLAEKAKDRFGRFSHVTIENLDSAVFLPRVLRDLGSRGVHSLVWLDAHFSGDVHKQPTAGQGCCPLLTELDAIAAVESCPPVVAIDDMEDMNGSTMPTAHEICRRLHMASPTKYLFQCFPEFRRGVLMCFPVIKNSPDSKTNY